MSSETGTYERAPAGTVRPERAFNTAILVSAVRCTLTYVVFPFVAPLLSIAPGVGPVVGIIVGTIAIVANLYSVNRFRASTHRLRRPMILINTPLVAQRSAARIRRAR